jgi:putative endonuclease
MNKNYKKDYYVYIMSNRYHGTLYIGSTNDLNKRIWEHKSEIVEKSFTSKYHLHRLVYYEPAGEMIYARRREYSIKKWSRVDKYRLIEKKNKFWEDLKVPLPY